MPDSRQDAQWTDAVPDDRSLMLAVFGVSRILKGLTKTISGPSLPADLREHLGWLNAHLGYGKYMATDKSSGNSRHGFSRKVSQGEFGAVECGMLQGLSIARHPAKPADSLETDRFADYRAARAIVKALLIARYQICDYPGSSCPQTCT